MSIFKKIAKGIGKATKAVGKGIGNAAKFTAKNPLKVIAPIAGVAGVLATGGAIAPGLITKLAASKVGKTVFGKMVGGVMKSGAIVKNEIAKTLKGQGKSASKKDVDTIAQGLQEQVTQLKGAAVPIDSTSSSAEESMSKLKQLEQKFMALVDPATRQTINAERSVLIDNPATNGIFPASDIPTDAYDQMQQAGDIKQNLLGNVGSIASMLGLNATTAAKAQDVVGILTGQNSDPYTQEDYNQGLTQVEKSLNQSSIVPDSVLNFFKKPVVWIIAGIAVVYYLFTNNNSKKRRF